MSVENKEPEVKDENVSEDQPQETQEPKQPDENVELGFYKTEFENMKKQMEEMRRLNEELKKSSETKKNNPSQSEIELLKQELDRARRENEEIRQSQINQQKISQLKQEAERLGLKKNYMDKLDRFINVKDLSTDNKYAYEIAMKNLQREMPDLFGEKSSSIPIATDTSTDIGEYSMSGVKSKIKELINAGKLQEAQNLVDKYNIEKL